MCVCKPLEPLYHILFLPILKKIISDFCPLVPYFLPQNDRAEKAVLSKCVNSPLDITPPVSFIKWHLLHVAINSSFFATT